MQNTRVFGHGKQSGGKYTSIYHIAVRIFRNCRRPQRSFPDGVVLGLFLGSLRSLSVGLDSIYLPVIACYHTFVLECEAVGREEYQLHGVPAHALLGQPVARLVERVAPKNELAVEDCPPRIAHHGWIFDERLMVETVSPVDRPTELA